MIPLADIGGNLIFLIVAGANVVGTLKGTPGKYTLDHGQVRLLDCFPRRVQLRRRLAEHHAVHALGEQLTRVLVGFAYHQDPGTVPAPRVHHGASGFLVDERA